jgi:spermidine synthase
MSEFAKRNTIRIAALCFLFFLSGVSGLAYQISWSRQLQNCIGSSIVAINAVLIAFFCGMMIGSFLFSGTLQVSNVARQFGILQCTLGLWVLLSPALFSAIDKMYVAAAPFALDNTAARFSLGVGVSLLFYLVPCVVMGATMPVMARWIAKYTNENSYWMGIAYAANTLGGVAGALLAGFVWIKLFGLHTTLCIGASINFLIALIALVWALREKTDHVPASRASVLSGISDRSVLRFYLLFAAHGACGLGYEIAWIRTFIQTFTASTYAFSAVVIVFLFGSGIGSAIGGWLVKRQRNATVLIVLCEGSIAGSAVAFLHTARLIPKFYPWLVHSFGLSPWAASIAAAITVATTFILLPTMCMGAVFPFILQAVRSKKDSGAQVGMIYGFNTAGSILGCIIVGFALVSAVGVRFTIVLLLIANLLIMVWALAIAGKRRAVVPAIAFFALCVICAFLSPKDLYGYWSFARDFRRLFYTEDSAANVGVWQGRLEGQDYKMLLVNNVYSEGGTDPHALLIQRREGHLPVLMHKNPHDVLVVGLATGVTLSSVASHPVNRIDCVEIVPSLLKTIHFFDAENGAVYNDPRVHLHIDDGRSFIKSSSQKYDLIIQDLFQVSSAGTGNLYSREHVEACRKLLRENGVLVQWFPLQQMGWVDFTSAVKSFADAFPCLHLWLADSDPDRAYCALVASLSPIDLDVEEMKKRIGRCNAAALGSVGFDDPYFVLSNCIMETEAVRGICNKAPDNTYDHPTVEFSSPRQLDAQNHREVWAALTTTPTPLHYSVNDQSEQDSLTCYKKTFFALLLAQCMEHAGDLPAADSKYDSILAVLPHFPDASVLAGKEKISFAENLFRQGNDSIALVKLNEAVGLGCNDPYLSVLKSRIALSHQKR